MMNIEKLQPTSGIFTNYIFKAIPLAFDESMSYLETLYGILNYLKNTIIPTVNNNADAVSELQSLFTQLQSYVDHYFDNLDVQQEINNKLDEMALNGQLSDIIAQYVDPIIQQQNNMIQNQDKLIEIQNNNISAISNQVNTLNTKITNALGNTPIPVNSIDDMTETDKIYVLTTTGHWFYYDSTTSQFKDGGVYQATEIGTNAINISNLDIYLQKAQAMMIPYFDRTDYESGKFIDFNDSTGNLGNYNQLSVSGFIPINKNYKTLYLNFKNQNIGRVSANFYDLEQNYISNVPYITNMDANFVVTLNIPNNAYFIKITFLTQYLNDADLLYYDDISNLLNITNNNLLDLSNQLNDYITENNVKYIKDLRNVVDFDFKSQNNSFNITNIFNLTENGITGTGYGKIIYKDFIESDICKNSCEFIYTNENLKLSLSIGKMLAVVQTDINTLSLNNGYDSTSNIPPITESINIENLTIGHKYCLELIKIGMYYETNLIDLNDLTKYTCIINYLKNTGFGRSQINLFSGTVTIYNYKYFLPFINENEILFLGDSTTEGVDVVDLTKRWCYQLKIDYFKTRNCTINGVGGNTCNMAFTRLQRIIESNLYNNLKYCIIYLGLNGSVNDYTTYMPQIIETCKNNNIKPIVCIPQLYNNDVALKRDFALSQNWDLIRFDLTNLTKLHPNDNDQKILLDYAIKSLNYLM